MRTRYQLIPVVVFFLAVLAPSGAAGETGEHQESGTRA